MRPAGQQTDLADALTGAHVDGGVAAARVRPTHDAQETGEHDEHRLGRLALGVEHGAAWQTEPFEFGGDRGAGVKVQAGEQRHRCQPRRQAGDGLPAQRRVRYRVVQIIPARRLRLTQRRHALTRLSIEPLPTKCTDERLLGVSSLNLGRVSTRPIFFAATHAWRADVSQKLSTHGRTAISQLHAERC